MGQGLVAKRGCHVGGETKGSGQGDVQGVLPCARRTARPNNTKMSEFGAKKGLPQDHARRRVARALEKPKLPESFQQSPVTGKEREGRG